MNYKCYIYKLHK